MERRRLKFFQEAPFTPWNEVPGGGFDRVLLPGRALSVTDTEQGNLATLWALDLLEAMKQAGHPIPVVFCAFGELPELPLPEHERALSATLGRVHLCSVSAGPGGGAAALTTLPRAELVACPCWVIVGLPALLSFDAGLSVLVTGEVSQERWPAGLRELRGEVTLELGAVRPALSQALARALLTTS